MPGFEIFGEEERKEVREVLETGVLFRYGFEPIRKGRWKARTFEEELAGRFGVPYCHLCSSGTAALSIALAACGIGAGDEVIVPPFTFVATIESILFAGAVPVFAEIDRTLCLDPNRLTDAITSRTRAVIPVHMCGSMARIEEMRKVCNAHHLVLIEDACQSFGATFEGKALGGFGQMGCFSFDSVKTITCGEGGGVITQDRDRYLTAKQYADHGHDHEGTDRGLDGHPILGTNFRISELNAAVGLAQLRKLDFILEKQRRNKATIKEKVRNIPGVEFREIPDEAGDSATFFSFFLPDEDRARKTIRGISAAGIDGCTYWYDNNWHYFRKWKHIQRLSFPAKLPVTLLTQRPDYEKISLPQSESIMKRVISMQIKLSWSEQDLETRIRNLVQILNRI
ncbi:MAG: DegT/DnrJ/EryC1/StrS family aminotransferase [Thermodesulfobacteriota bacterium]